MAVKHDELIHSGMEMFFQLSADLFCIVDDKGFFVKVNPAWKSVLGYEPEDLLGRNISGFIHPDDQTNTFQEVDHLNQGMNTLSFVNRYKAITGDFRTIDWKANQGEDDGLIYAIGRDITEHRANVSKLRRSEEKYRSIFENIQDVYLMAGLDGKIVEVSPSVEQMFLYDREELIGAPAEILYADPSKREEVVRSINQHGELSDLEILYKKKNNELFHASVSVHQAYDKDFNLIGIEGIIHDITERKRVQDELVKLSRAVEQSPVSIIITDPDGNIEYANPKAFQTTGYTFEELKGNNPRVLKSGETSQGEYKTLWDTILSGGLWQGVFHNKRKNGELYWESAAISPVYDSQGKVAHFIAVKEDITARKKAEDSLREANATKDKLFSIISHDLRGPIGNMMPILEILLSEQNLSEQVRRDYLQVLKNSSERIYSLLENLLGWSRSQQNKLQIRPRNLSINELIRRNMELLGMNARNKGIQMEFTTTEEIHVFVDENSIDLVIRNLISNAVKFTPVDGKVTIRAFREQETVTVEITDTGIGIPEEVLNTLFNPENFTSTFGTANEKGTGLGLKLSQDFIARNGGRIWAESEEGKGSRFYFTLPVSK
jgi:PAS domain S-box-containing protein